jgi:mono/diheme cytochrome c family protein
MDGGTSAHPFRRAVFLYAGGRPILRSTLRSTLQFGIVLLAAVGVGAFWIATAPRPAFAPSQAAELEQRGDPVRGKTVFDAGDCASCHTSPGQADRTRLGGGMALASPFGTLRPPNISPDPADGIGNWRTIDLANALMSGVAPDGRHYYPALPYTSYVRMTVTDVQDLMAYLRTLPPVSGKAPPHELPLPFKIRRLIGGWKLLFFDRSPLPPAPDRSAEWHRGRYLVEALGHCAECHSARNVFGGIKSGSRLAGGIDQELVGYDPNITPNGIGRWTEGEILRAITTGQTPELRQLGSSMEEVVENIAALPAGDQRAIAAYLATVPPRNSPDAVKER